MERLDKTLTNEEDIKLLRQKLNKVKEDIYKLLSSNNDDHKFFDEIFNIQKEVLSSTDIREAKLEKEFNQILKILNLLHSTQDNKIKDTRENILKLLSEYIDTKEKLLELTEINSKSFEMIKEVIKDFRKELSEQSNKKSGFSQFFIITGGLFEKLFKIPAFQKLFSYLVLLALFLFLMLSIKHLDTDLYNDTKNFMEKKVNKIAVDIASDSTTTSTKEK